MYIDNIHTLHLVCWEICASCSWNTFVYICTHRCRHNINKTYIISWPMCIRYSLLTSMCTHIWSNICKSTNGIFHILHNKMLNYKFLGTWHFQFLNLDKRCILNSLVPYVTKYIHHKLAPSLYECFYNTLTICSMFNVDTIIDMMLKWHCNNMSWNGIDIILEHLTSYQY
jgi:hypothetical protein